MYVKDSVIEAHIGKDLKKQRLKGRIEEVEHLLRLQVKGRYRSLKLQERLEKLRGKLKLLSD